MCSGEGLSLHILVQALCSNRIVNHNSTCIPATKVCHVSPSSTCIPIIDEHILTFKIHVHLHTLARKPNGVFFLSPIFDDHLFYSCALFPCLSRYGTSSCGGSLHAAKPDMRRDLLRAAKPTFRGTLRSLEPLVRRNFARHGTPRAAEPYVRRNLTCGWTSHAVEPHVRRNLLQCVGVRLRGAARGGGHDNRGRRLLAP